MFVLARASFLVLNIILSLPVQLIAWIVLFVVTCYVSSETLKPTHSLIHRICLANVAYQLLFICQFHLLTKEFDELIKEKSVYVFALLLAYDMKASGCCVC